MGGQEEWEGMRIGRAGGGGRQEEGEGRRRGRAFAGQTRANKSITSNCESQRPTGAQRKMRIISKFN